MLLCEVGRAQITRALGLRFCHGFLKLGRPADSAGREIAWLGSFDPSADAVTQPRLPQRIAEALFVLTLAFRRTFRRVAR
jgi:hypothetical protein